MPPRGENKDIIENLFIHLDNEFGNLAPQIIKSLVDALGGVRITFPDHKFLYRKERNLKIQKNFNGHNYEELAICHGLKTRQVRLILAGHQN